MSFGDDLFVTDQHLIHQKLPCFDFRPINLDHSERNIRCKVLIRSLGKLGFLCHIAPLISGKGKITDCLK
jgi:hypothetical protein